MPVNEAGYSGGRAGSLVLSDFGGGRVLVPNRGITSLMPNQSPRSFNIDMSGRSIRRYTGDDRVNTTDPVGVSGGISSIHYDSLDNKIYIAKGTQMAYLNGTDITGLSGATGLTASKPWTSFRVADYLFFMNGVDAPKMWKNSISSWSAITTPPVTWVVGNYPKIGVQWMGRGFAAGNPLEPDILYYSKLYDGTVWTATSAANGAGSIRIGNDGSKIRALYPIANGLLIFKDSGLYYLAGGYTYDSGTTTNQFDQTKFDWRLISPVVNAVGQRAVVAVDQRLFAWGRDDVYQIETTFGSSQVQVSKVGKNILSEILQVPESYYDFVTAAHYKDRRQVWFNVLVPGDPYGYTRSVEAYCYDTLTEDNEGDILGAWCWKSSSSDVVANVIDATGAYQIYHGSLNASFPNLYKANANNNAFYGTDYLERYIPWEHRTAFNSLGESARGRSNFVFFTLGPLSKLPIAWSYAYDYSEQDYDNDQIIPETSESTWNDTGGTTWGTTVTGTIGTWNQGVSSEIKNMMFGRGRSVQHRFSYLNQGEFSGNANVDILRIVHPVTTVGVV